jgi:glycosyltransferase involved in cell wall biosynthesis/GT2 family glycosyltransferase
MKIRILLNALDCGDAVSSCCISIKKRCGELGIDAQIYAEFFHPEVASHGVHLSRLLAESSEDDILLHQFFNESRHLVLAEQFPGRRVLIYQNITPPEWFPAGSELERASQRGIDQVRSVRKLYEFAVGASEFSRRDLENMGFPNTGVFPVLVDPEALRALPPSPEILAQRKPETTTFLFVGRVAPNKRIEDLLHFLAAYRAQGGGGRLVVVGNDAQLPGYRDLLLRVAAELSLEYGKDFLLTGKVPAEHLNSYYRIADAFVCMSEHEGFCVPLIESMASGLPTFAYAATACEQTMGGGAGVFFSKDFPALAQHVAAILTDPARKAGLLRAQEKRLQDFTSDAERQLVSGLLERVGALPSRAERRGNPVVSIVVNTYNRAEQLERCIESLEGQTYRNFEVVVVNGPSTDNTITAMERFGETIKLLQTESRVLSLSRNCGIQAASGELIAFIDDDAIAHPDWLDAAIPAFDDPEVGSVGGLVYAMSDGRVEFGNGQLDRNAFVRAVNPEPGTAWDWSDGWLNTVRGCNCVFRATALRDIGGFDEEIEYYHDEADVVMRLRLAGFKTVHRPRAIVYHEAAYSHNRSSRHDLNWFAIVKNGIYVPLKNHPGTNDRVHTGLRIARSLFNERLKHPWYWWRTGSIGLGLFCRIEFRCIRGLATGIRKGLRPSPKHPEFLSHETTEFRRFSSSPARLLSVCLISQGLPPAQTGGVATYTMTLATKLRDLGCHVHIISKGAESQSERRDGIWLHAVSPQRLGHAVDVGADHPVTSGILDHSAAVCAKVLEIAARYGVDIVESSSWDSEGLVSVLDQRIPVVVRVVTPLRKVIETQCWTETEDLRLASDLEGEMLGRAAAVIFSTHSMRELLQEEFGIQPTQSARIPFGMTLPTLEPTANGSRRKRVLFVGRLEPRKGIHVLLEAIPGILRAIPEVEFQIVGKDVPEEGGSVAEKWRHHHPEYKHKVQFLGEVTDVELSQCYEKCDLLVAPSLYESFGLIYVEAMARGKAVIGTTAGGIPEVVRHGITGILVPPGDTIQFEQAVTNLLRDDTLRGRLAQAGYRSYFEDFSAEAMAKHTLDLYWKTIWDWNAQRTPVWIGNFSTCLHGSGSRVEWDPEGHQFSLVAEVGIEHVFAYGPYMPLDAGLYRAEFGLWMEDPAAMETLVAQIDVFAGRILAERRVFGRDLGSGNMLDLFFTMEGRGERQVEFRVTTSGVARLHLRTIFVSSFNHAHSA